MTGWLPGLVLGAISAFALIGIVIIGVALGAAALILIAWKGPRAIATAGFVTGAGATWTLLFARVMVSCAAENATPGMGCEAGDIGLWVLGSGAIAAVGLIGTILVARRAGHRPDSS